MYLRILCEIHISGSVYKHPYVSQDPLQDPCIGFMSQHLQKLRSLCKIHVSDSSPVAFLSSDFVALRRRNTNFDLRRRVLRAPSRGKQSGRDPRDCFAQAERKFCLPETCLSDPAQGKQSDRVVPVSETQTLNGRDAFFVALRKRNPNLTSRDASCVHIIWIHKESQPDERTSPRHYSETPKNFRFRAGETQILMSGVAFFVALRSEKQGEQKFAPPPKRLYPYRKNPSVCYTVWTNIYVNQKYVKFSIFQWCEMSDVRWVVRDEWLEIKSARCGTRCLVWCEQCQMRIARWVVRGN